MACRLIGAKSLSDPMMEYCQLNPWECQWGTQPLSEPLKTRSLIQDGRDHFVYAPCQWETTLHFNVVSHWLGAYTKWSLDGINNKWTWVNSTCSHKIHFIPVMALAGGCGIRSDTRSSELINRWSSSMRTLSSNCWTLSALWLVSYIYQTLDELLIMIYVMFWVTMCMFMRELVIYDWYYLLCFCQNPFTCKGLIVICLISSYRYVL